MAFTLVRPSTPIGPAKPQGFYWRDLKLGLLPRRVASGCSCCAAAEPGRGRLFRQAGDQLLRGGRFDSHRSATIHWVRASLSLATVIFKHNRANGVVTLPQPNASDINKKCGDSNDKLQAGVDFSDFFDNWPAGSGELCDSEVMPEGQWPVQCSTQQCQAGMLLEQRQKHPVCPVLFLVDLHPTTVKSGS
jgi:hypothetical protein